MLPRVSLHSWRVSARRTSASFFLPDTRYREDSWLALARVSLAVGPKEGPHQRDENGGDRRCGGQLI